ncbi:GNAT family N-acetyltransferase [Dyella sp.]|uniref:GNAT family N-acetyltransferase n=1 Tax=Dyella sp. TaxID=1869338 RepID=UPI002ED03333
MSQSPSLRFRAAAVADIPAIVALVESAYRGDSGRLGWTTESDLLDGQRTDVEGVAALIGVDGSQVLLAEHDGALLACCHVAVKQGDGYFGMFAVNPLSQKAGLGKALLGEAERIAAQEWRCPVMRMTVIEQRADLIAWYERRGYRRTGQFEPFPYGDERFGIPRRDDLRFEWLAKNLAQVSA